MIGVIGGSGFYSLLSDVRRHHVKTPYGEPSGDLATGVYEGVEVAFLPRHGIRHTLPPAQIPYQANLWAMQSLGVDQLVAPTAAGSLQAGIRPGDFVICDQFVDRTSGRPDTFHTGPRVAHVSAADPYCPRLRRLAADKCREAGVTVHPEGTVVVINGPRFSTRAESRWYAGQGWQVINMTQYPEVILARELGICYVNLALITDHDAGLSDRLDSAPVSVAEVERVFASNNERVREVILGMIPAMAGAARGDRDCGCSGAMDGAFVGG